MHVYTSSAPVFVTDYERSQDPSRRCHCHVIVRATTHRAPVTVAHLCIISLYHRSPRRARDTDLIPPFSMEQPSNTMEQPINLNVVPAVTTPYVDAADGVSGPQWRSSNCGRQLASYRSFGLAVFSYRSHGFTAFSALSLGVTLFSIASLNGAFTILSFNSFASVLSFNSALSVLSVNSFASINSIDSRFSINSAGGSFNIGCRQSRGWQFRAFQSCASDQPPINPGGDPACTDQNPDCLVLKELWSATGRKMPWGKDDKGMCRFGHEWTGVTCDDDKHDAHVVAVSFVVD